MQILTKRQKLFSLKKQTENLELKNAMPELKKSPKGLNSRHKQTEGRISEIEDRSFEVTITKGQKR